MSPTAKPSVLMITVHTGGGPRKAGMTFIGETLAAQGHKVSFLTVGNSLLGSLLGRQPHGAKALNTWYAFGPRLKGFVWMPLFHPINLRNTWLNWLAAPIFRLYPHLLPTRLTQHLAGHDIIVVETCVGLLLMPRLLALNPGAKVLYNVSDRMPLINISPLAIEAEAKHIRRFHLVRLLAKCMEDEYRQRFHHPNTHYVEQALKKDLFKAKQKNPFTHPQNAIVIGDMLFDAAAVTHLAQTFPDVGFHLFGKGTRLPSKLPNVIEHGEVAFTQLLPYLQHATIGLAPYQNGPRDKPGYAEYLSQSSLKMIQYTYCQLPIVAPHFAAAGRKHVCAYAPGDTKKLTAAFKKALKYPRETIPADQVRDWESMVKELLNLLAAGTKSA